MCTIPAATGIHSIPMQSFNISRSAGRERLRSKFRAGTPQSLPTNSTAASVFDAGPQTRSGFRPKACCTPITAYGSDAMDRNALPEIAAARIDDDTRVIGYAHNGEARAYPLFILDRHELVNDRVGGKPVRV